MKASVQHPRWTRLVAFGCVLGVLLYLSGTCEAKEEEDTSVEALIVQFGDYRKFEEHSEWIRGVLASKWRECRDEENVGAPLSPCVWKVQRRKIKTTQVYPTDFVSILVCREIGKEFRELIERQTEVVKKVMEDKALGRTLQTVPYADSGRNIHPRSLPLRSRKLQSHPQLGPFSAHEAWRAGYTGNGVRVAVFDTGISSSNLHFAEEIERTNWTDEDDEFEDLVGHGTFVAGLIAGRHPHCPGIAPDAQIVVFRVFSGTQTSYTSWFLDAFNFALYSDIDILNLSIGGPDFSDVPFVEKVNELTAAGIIVVSAIGNDGPVYGSLNNPADMMDVIGVGGVEPHGEIANFSSRGMTTHDLGFGFPTYGAVKPDLVAFARSLAGPDHTGNGCTKLSGTSVASPVVAGAVALMLSAVPKEYRKQIANPASVKLALWESSRRLPRAPIFEQGAGLLDIPAAVKAMRTLASEYVANLGSNARTPTSLTGGENPRKLNQGLRIALFPEFLDLSRSGCPYMWPFCSQPLFYGGSPLTVNISVLNPSGVKSRILWTQWIPDATSNRLLDVSLTLPERFWPWSGGLGVHLSIAENVEEETTSYGVLRIAVESIFEHSLAEVEFPIRVVVVPTPPRERRILWDIFHSLKYPPAYVPRDSLTVGKDMLDWHGDHPHTNFNDFYNALRNAGYFIDILDQPFTCLTEDFKEGIGYVFLIDTEDFLNQEERQVVNEMVKSGAHLVVAAEWYNAGIMEEIGFQDDNTRSYWKAVIGGGNVPAVNQVLEPFGIGLSDRVFSGDVAVGKHRFPFRSGVSLSMVPSGSEVIFGHSFLRMSSVHTELPTEESPVVFALVRQSGTSGSILVYGDTFCLDSVENSPSNPFPRCFSFFVEAIRAMETKRSISGSTILVQSVSPALGGTVTMTPSVLSLFRSHSKVLQDVEADEPVFRSPLACLSRGDRQVRPTLDGNIVDGEGRSSFENVANRGLHPHDEHRGLLYDSFMSTKPMLERYVVLFVISATLVSSFFHYIPRSHIGSGKQRSFF